jgi:chromosome partitioning protein
MKVIAVINHKGGVGKTTFTGSTAQALALVGHRVLALDNDSQHNLSMLLGVGIKQPGIRDVYLADRVQAPEVLLKSIRKTSLPDLHLISSCSDLSDADIREPYSLKNAVEACRLDRFYDYLLIDNGPGTSRLQASAIYAADEIFVPTELRQFAVDGLVEIEKVLRVRYPDGAKITHVIPNFFKNTRRHVTFIAALNKLFPGKVSSTAIPVDPVFDEVVTDGKILFLHRLYSKGAACYLKLVEELFTLNEDTIWESVLEKRKQRLGDEARQRLLQKKESGAA